MKRANRLMLVAGVVLAAVAFVAVLAFGSPGQQQAAPVIPEVSVVIAATDLALGTELTADRLTTTTRPQSDASGTFQHPEELVGRIVRRAVAAGQAFNGADFETGVDFAVAQSIRPGLRAIAVPLSRVDSVGALLQAGDFVDVILSLTDADALNPIVIANPNANQPGVDGSLPDPYISIDEYINNTTVKVVVQNVQVLAVLPRSSEPSNALAPAGSIEPDVVIILAVTPQQAEIVRFVQLDGNISLVLRAPADSGAADITTSGMTLKELVENYGVLPPAAVTP